MWRSCNEWSQADKDKHNKEARETNKAWGEKTKEKDEKELLMLLDLKKINQK